MMNGTSILEFLLPHARLNRGLRILITLNTSMTFVVGLFAPFFAVFVQHLGGGIAIAGLSWAMFPIMSGILILFFTKWGLRVKEQELLIALGYILRAMVFLSYAFMTSIAQLIATQILWGIAAAFSIPAFDAVYQKHTTSEESIVQWGGVEGLSSIATGVAALMGGVAIEHFGYRSIFFGMSFISAILAIFIWRLPREVL